MCDVQFVPKTGCLAPHFRYPPVNYREFIPRPDDFQPFSARNGAQRDLQGARTAQPSKLTANRTTGIKPNAITPIRYRTSLFMAQG
jgi:hypothetical protein